MRLTLSLADTACPAASLAALHRAYIYSRRRSHVAHASAHMCQDNCADST